MKLLNLVLAFLAIASGACVPNLSKAPESASPVMMADLCGVLDRPDNFDGKEIDAHAILVVGFESSFLYDPRCMSDDQLVWFEPRSDAVSTELDKYITPETDEFKEKGLNRVAGRFVGVFRTKNGDGFGHLNSANHHITVTHALDLTPVSPDIPYPWLDSRMSDPKHGGWGPLVLYFEHAKAECLGRCPDYRMAVFADGRLTFEGRENTKVKGTVSAELSKTELGEIVEPFRRASLAEMQDTYTRDRNCSTPVLSDSPVVTLTFRDGGSAKRIIHYAGCHNKDGDIGKLLGLERLVEAFLERKGWL